jgi:hypothetical protein
MDLNRHVLMCWPSINRIRSLCPLHTWCQIPLLVREFLSEMLSYLRSCCDPDAILACDVVDNLLEGLETSWLANAAAVKGNGHHLWGPFLAFFIQSVKSTFDVVVKVCRGPESGGNTEFVIVAICKVLFMEGFLKGAKRTIRVRDHQHPLGVLIILLRWDINPVGKVIRIRIRVP